MALFKIHKGERFPDSGQITKATEGFAYFTTDDGKFYIDIAGDGTTDAIIRDKEHPLGNRVPLNAAQADYVKNNFILRIANGNTEDNNLYTFNGSETKQLNFQADNGISFISAQNSLTIGINASEINTGILRTGFGGTGNNTYVANRLIYSETENKLNSTSNISTDGNSLNFLKDNGEYPLITNKYNDVNYVLLKDHHDGNISLNASGEGLHLGNANTAFIRLSNNIKVYSAHSFVESNVMSSEGWVRLAALGLNNQNALTSSVFDFIITRSYTTGAPEAYTVRATFGSGTCTLTVLGGNYRAQRFTDFRVVRDNTNHKAYFEIYLAQTPANNTVTIRAIDYTNKATLEFLLEPETLLDSDTNIDIWKVKLRTAAIISNQSLYLSTTEKGLFLTDSTSSLYGAIYDNGSNLWVGATATNTSVHTGKLYLHAGKNADGYINRSVYISAGNSDTATSSTNYVIAYNYGGSSSQPVYVDSSGKVQSITGALGNDITGNAATATEFKDSATITLSGDISGSASSKKGPWAITTTIGAGKVTNNMLAGSITNDKLDKSTIGIAGTNVALGSSIDKTTLLSNLGLTNAAHYIGKATEELSDGGTENPTISGYDFANDRKSGDIVLGKDGDKEYIWGLNGWELLGPVDTIQASTATGTNNRMAYYSAANMISASSHYTDDTHISVADSTLHSDYNLYVNGAIGAEGNIIPITNNSYNLGTTDTLRWKSGFFTTSLRVGAINTTASDVNKTKNVYIGPDGFYTNGYNSADTGFFVRGEGTLYARLFINKIGSTETPGIATLQLGNSTDSSEAKNSNGTLQLYSNTTKYTSIKSSLEIAANHLNYLPIYGSTSSNTYYGRLVGIYKGTTSGSNGFSDVGSTSQPVYVTANGVVKAITGALGNDITGNAATATKWASPQQVYVTLGTASTTTTIQGGSTSAQTIGVDGTLGTAHGGTGNTSYTSSRLVYTNTATKFATGTIESDGNNIILGDGDYSLSRTAQSGNWNQGVSKALIKITSATGAYPLFAMKSHSGHWLMTQYESSNFYDHLMFGFLSDVDVYGVTNAKNHYDYKVRLIPTIYETNTETVTDRAFVTANYASNSAQTGNTNQPIYIDNQGVATAVSLKPTLNNLLSSLTEGTADALADAGYIISTNNNGATNDWYLRSNVTIWNYIKGKYSSTDTTLNTGPIHIRSTTDNNNALIFDRASGTYQYIQSKNPDNNISIVFAESNSDENTTYRFTKDEFYPKTNNSKNLGLSGNKWANVYATNFNGALKGNADTATAANITSTDNAIVRFDGTAGKFQNSTVIIDDNGYINSKQFKTSSSETILNDVGYITIYPYDRNTYGNTTPTPAKFIFTEKAYTTGVPAKTLMAWSGIDNIKINNFIGALKGNADTATKVNNTLTITLNNSAKTFNGSADTSISFYAPTTGGAANTQALVGNGATTAPEWVNISPSITITAGTASATPKVNVTVLGQSGTAQAITTATTGVYGATKLTDAYTSTDATLAATGKSILAAIQTLDVTAVGVAAATGNRYISQISETDGKISAVLATATIGTTTTPIWVDAGTIKPGSYELKATVDNGTQHYLTMYTTADGRTIGPASDRASTVLLSSTVADTLKLTSSANTNYLTYTSSIGTWKTGMGENADEYWIYSNSLSNWRIAINNSNFHLRSSSYQKNTTPSSNASGAGIYTRDTDNNYIWILRGYKGTSNTMGVQLCTYGHSTNDTGTSTFAIYRTSTPDTYINWTGGKIGNSIYPWANATYNIGSNDLAWNQLHLTYDSSSARNKGIRFMNTGTLVGNIGATAQGLGIYGNGHLYLRPSLTETQGMEITSTAVQPATDHDINLGTTSLRWNQIHAKSYYIEDTRNEDLTAATNDKAIRFFFSSNNMPDSKYWSGIHVRGWNGGYSSWELVGPAHNVDQSTTPLYIKTSNINTGWGEWRPILDSYNGVMRFHYGGTGTTTKILITINNTSSWMVSFTLRLYQGYQATDLQISGYNYNNTDTPWSSPQAIVLGSTAYDGPLVYFGYTDTQKLWIAVDGARYTGVDVFGVTNGYTQINLKDFCTITNVSTLPGTLQTTVRAYSRLAHNVVSDTGDITLHNQPGTFAFSGNGDPWSGNDWVGFQVGNNADKFQIVRVNSNNLLFRQNDSGGVNTSWGTWEKILTDVNTSWAAWTAGTTAGPQANLSLSGTNIRSAAIPSASTSASGIVTTAAQTFAGTKTFTNPETINSTGNGAAINFKFSNAASANTIYGQNWITYANNGGRFYWREWGGTANGRTAGYEQYCLPACNAGRTTAVTYDIFTSKNQAEPSKGTANRAAYYSAADTIEDAGSIYMDTTTIGFLKDNGAYDLIKNTYNSTSYHLLYDHHNGNISLSASSLGLYLGYYDTTLIDFLHSAGAWNSTGLGIGTTSPGYKLDVRGTGYFTNTVHINKNSGTGLVDADTAPLLIGTLTGASLAIGNNAIQARSNHTESKLWFNYEGGSTSFGSSTSKTAPTTFFGTVTPGANNTYDLGSETLRWQQIHGNLNGARAYSNGTKQNWEKVATWSGSCKNVNDDTSLTLSISDGYPNPSNTPHHNGLLYINFRGSSNSTTAGRTHCKWIVGNNITPDDWVLTYKITSAYAITVNLYVNCTSSWQSWNIVKINEHTWGTTVNEWQLLDASSGIESLPTNETQIISTLSDISNTVPNVRIANGNGTVKYFVGVNSTGSQQLYYNSSIHTTTSNVLMGAAWNDYAEFRQLKENKMYATTVKPGRVVYENGDDTLSISSNRLMRGCSIVSDTYGFGIGESEKAQLPVAVSGRVLAYPYEDREKFKNHIGWPVCSGPNGTVSIMTEEEEIKYPSRIIGIISAVPDYEIWHGGADVKVNGRVWIKVR